jgi:ATP/maltotriose-dependent transcriptional regulator MalT/DNA-binding SARP family transcriptional activator
MRRLPPYHVPRARLTERCAGHQVVVVEAAAGYGKSTLGAELVGEWRAVGIEVPLDHADMTAALLVARLHAAVLRVGFTEAAAAAAGQDVTGAADAMISALADEPCVFIIDDAHNAASDAGALIDHIATQLVGEQRLLVLARHLPKGAERLRRAENLHLSSADLALTPDETLALCRSGFGLKVGPDTAKVLGRATAGWTAATALAAARAARTGEAVGAVAEVATSPDHPAGAVAAILEEAVVTLGTSSLSKLSQVARLPLLDAELVDLVTAEEGFFERALEAGLPFTPAQGQWWDLPGPVRDHLATFSPLDSDAMRRAAQQYRERGELGWALQLLLASGDAAEAATVLAGTAPEVAEAMDALELEAVFDQLPQDVVDANPYVLLLVARGLRVATRWDRGHALLERAHEIAARSGDAVLERAVGVELAQELLRELNPQPAEDAARSVLRDAAPSEKLTRARAYHILGQALCWRLDSAGRRDEAALAEAEECFSRASNLYQALGMRSATSALVPYWAISIEFARGHASEAMDRLEKGLNLVAGLPRRWAYLMCFRAWVAAELGQDEVCRTSAQEALRVGEQLDSDLFRAHGHWKLAILASYREDAQATLHHLRQVELHRGTWWGPASGDFLADAADLLDRVGHTALAWEYLARVKAEPKDAGHLVAMAEAALEARHGDPVVAEERLKAPDLRRIEPREYWRVSLLGAFAAFRRGEDRAAGAWAARAFEEAARLGQPQLPLIRERAITEQLLGLAVDTGQPAAAALRASALPVALTVLGRFELTVAGRPVGLRPGQEAQLLKLVAVSAGQLHAEQAIETLWPEGGRAEGRNRLRTVLSRLRSVAGNVLVRQGDLLVLDRSVSVDFEEMLAEARRAETLASTDLALAAAIARGAIVRYRGELLPEDRYEDWAERPRQRARRAMLDLLDLCASEAARRGDLDGVRRMVERTIEFAPYDDLRYLHAATTLLEQGRRGEALSVVHRARSAFAEIGLEPPRPLLELERSIVA